MKRNKRLSDDARSFRGKNPHKWAEDVEDALAGKALLTMLVVAAVIGLGFNAWTERQRLREAEATIETIEDFLDTTFPSPNLEPAQPAHQD